jgi:hypothetical protein
MVEKRRFCRGCVIIETGYLCFKGDNNYDDLGCWKYKESIKGVYV